MPYIIIFIVCISGLVYIGIKEELRRRKLVSEKRKDYNISNEEIMQSIMQPPLKVYDINKPNLEENKVKIVGFVKKILYIHTRSLYKKELHILITMIIRVARLSMKQYYLQNMRKQMVL